MKRLLLIIPALALLAGVVLFISRPDEPIAASISDTSGGPSFEVQGPSSNGHLRHSPSAASSQGCLSDVMIFELSDK